MLPLYLRMLEKHPVLTKCITNGLIMSVGDAVCQTVIEKGPFSLTRNANLFLISCFVGAPALHLWYCKLLPSIRSALFPNASKPRTVFYSVLLDELLFAPILYSAFFPTLQIVADRDIRSFGKGVELWRQKIWETIWNSWKVWPAASTVNFWFVPVKHQVLFVSCVSLFWSMCVSYIASN